MAKFHSGAGPLGNTSPKIAGTGSAAERYARDYGDGGLAGGRSASDSPETISTAPRTRSWLSTLESVGSTSGELTRHSTWLDTLSRVESCAVNAAKVITRPGDSAPCHGSFSEPAGQVNLGAVTRAATGLVAVHVNPCAVRTLSATW